MFKKPFYILIYDILLLASSFVLMIWLKPVDTTDYIVRYSQPFLIFLFTWLAAGFIFKKYRNLRKKSLKKITWDILSANLLVLSVCIIIVFAFQVFPLSRMLIFGTVLTASILELIGGYLIYNVAHASEEIVHYPNLSVTNYSTHEKFYTKEPLYAPIGKHEERIKKQLIATCGEKAYAIITENIDPFEPKTLILSTVTHFNVLKQPDEYYENAINIKNINDIRGINKFFRIINAKLPLGGMYIGCAETKRMRKKRILKKFPPVINISFYAIDFLFTRVLVKYKIARSICFIFTKGQNRVLSKTEILGRLYYSGFELVREITTPDKYFFVVHKIASPHRTPHAHYGLFIRLRRIGKNKKSINVYKMRTMYAYAEYLQDLVYQQHGTDDGDKARNDFRVTSMGKIFRRLWLDELPMVLNLIKGEIKLVGVRPLSKSKFNMYPKYMQDKRTKSKPGLIPPFYVDMPNSLEELIASEEKYLDQYFKRPFRTDVKYFFKAMYNILIRQARSK